MSKYWLTGTGVTWTPSEFPPKKDGYYYCIDNEKNIYVSYWLNNSFGCWSDNSEHKEWNRDTDILYWRNIRIPKPPKIFDKDALRRCHSYINEQNKGENK